MAEWGRRLARPIALADGRRLVTLRDAGRRLTAAPFDTVTHSEPLAHALDLLMRASESGDPDDIAAVTDQVEIVLRAWRLM